MYPKKELAQLVVSACHQYAIDTVVISPGSRNAPLTIGFSNHPEIRTMSIVDERCAAFFALGIAQQTQKPVAILCSSGSALLNYYPAVAEAFYSRIPLVVISADRPKHLIDIGDGQTIRQENVFANHILYSANLIEVDSKLDINANLLSKALHASVVKKGPVHINVPFDEPLYETVNELKTFHFDELTVKNNSKSSYNIEELQQVWAKAKKKMILVGLSDPNPKLQAVLKQFKKDASVIILTETTSNIASENTINAIDQLIMPLSEEALEALRPEILLTFGGMIVSKKIKQYLRNHPPKHHWHVDAIAAIDTYHCLTVHVDQLPTAFLPSLTQLKAAESAYKQEWLSIKQARRVKHRVYLDQLPFSDLKAFESVLGSIPDNAQLQLSNSSIVRYAQLFDVNDSLTVFCNRGTSGIDGSTSTAIGAAVASEQQTVLITGDLSFFYDANALWNSYIPNSFRIVIINNSGGGIFRIIPGPKTTNALDYFETPHQLTAKHLCKMHQFEYCAAASIAEVSNCLDDFYASSERPKLLEIFTDGEVNESVLKEYFNFLK